MSKIVIYFLLSLLLAACNPCRQSYCVYGPEEFVLDSYKIKEGKKAILEMQGENIEQCSSQFLGSYKDVILEEDILNISIYHPTRTDLVSAVDTVGKTIHYQVHNGVIDLPGIGPIKVRGLTLSEAKEAIASQYNAYISNIDVFLNFAARPTASVTLIGPFGGHEVPVVGELRLFDVIAKSGLRVEIGFDAFSGYVVRRGESIVVDFNKLIRQGDMTQNIVMLPGDKVYIGTPGETTITVLGEVGAPGIYPIPRGFTSLRHAIAAAGGIPFTGDRRCIQIIRGEVTNPKIYRLSWNHVTYLPNDSLLLMPGDTVFISEKPITKWNRFIDQLLPSSLLFDIGTRAQGVWH